MRTYQVTIPVGGCMVLHCEIPSGASVDETLDLIEQYTDNLSFDTAVGHFDLLVDSGSFWIVDHRPIVSLAGQLVITVPHKKTNDVASIGDTALESVKDLSFDFEDIGYFDLRPNDKLESTIRRTRRLIAPMPETDKCVSGEDNIRQ